MVKAQYKELIEREYFDGKSEDEVIKLCVSTDEEMKKCKVMSEAAYSRDIRPNYECIKIEQGGCAEALSENKVEAIVVQARDYSTYNLEKSKPIIFEKIECDQRLVVVADKGISVDDIKASTM